MHGGKRKNKAFFGIFEMPAAVFDVNFFKHVVSPHGRKRIQEAYKKAITKCWQVAWYENRFRKHYIIALRGNAITWDHMKSKLKEKTKLVDIKKSLIEARQLKDKEKKEICGVDDKDLLLFETARATGKPAYIVTLENRLKRIKKVKDINVINLEDLESLLEG